MVQRKSRIRKKKTSKKRGFGCIVVILLLLCSLFLVTCQKQRNINNASYRHSSTSNLHRHSSANNSHRQSESSPHEHQNEPMSVSTHQKEIPPTQASPDTTNETPSDKTQNIQQSPPANESHNNTVVSNDIEFSRGNPTEKRIAITFDAGASAKPVTLILKVLAKHNIKCTFFLTGKWMEQNRSMTRQIAEAGHEIGNHSYSHKRFTDLSDAEIANEIDKTNRLAIELTDQNTKPLFRCPFGARDKRVLKALADQGYKSVYWDIDSWDSVKKDITSKQIEDRVLEKVRNGSVILMHCGSQPTADALDSLLTKLEASGYEPVTVSQLAGF
jgi:peptidoglycan/xylan/chitin deacetylase (PgdA/CDA1 family)